MNSTRTALHKRLLQAATHKSERRRRSASSSLASPLSTLCNNHHHYNATIINSHQITSTKRQQQCQYFSSLPSPLKQAPCPFRTLNIPKESKYSHAKKSFLKIAMKHHPDTVGNDCEKAQQKSQTIFMKCRKALEALEECPKTGLAILKTTAELKRSMSNEEFDEWFEEETGHQSPFQFDLDPKVMREVADMHNDMEGSHGLDRDGGMWHLASMISNAVKQGKEGAESVLKLEAGAVRDGQEVEASGTLSRRRKRSVRRR